MNPFPFELQIKKLLQYLFLFESSVVDADHASCSSAPSFPAGHEGISDHSVGASANGGVVSGAAIGADAAGGSGAAETVSSATRILALEVVAALVVPAVGVVVAFAAVARD